ncbi:hypothetical protein Tco_0564687 [Tanacetum coccineum]
MVEVLTTDEPPYHSWRCAQIVSAMATATEPADVVEVFHNLSWKMVIVSKAFGWDYFLIRLVVSFSEFEASNPAPLRRLKCLLLHKDSVTS